MARESLVQNAEIAEYQASLLVLKGFRAVMCDIYRRRANIAKALGAGAQAKIDILEIAPLIIFRELADAVETVAGNIKTKPDPAGYVDGIARVGNACDTVDREHFIIA